MPEILSWPAALAVTVTPTIPAAFTAFCRSVAYAFTVSPAAIAGAVIVPVAPAVGPVMVRFVPEFTVASVPPLEPKL